MEIVERNRKAEKDSDVNVSISASGGRINVSFTVDELKAVMAALLDHGGQRDECSACEFRPQYKTVICSGCMSCLPHSANWQLVNEKNSKIIALKMIISFTFVVGHSVTPSHLAH